MRECDAYREKVDGLEIFYRAFSADDQCKRRRLHATNRQNNVVTAPPCRQRIRPRQIHPDKPICAAACKCGLLEIEKLGVVSQIVVGTLNADFVERVKQNPFDGLGIADEIKHLVDEQLTFAIGVARVNNFVRLRNQPLDDSELLFRRRIDLQLPNSRDNRQIFRAPRFISRVVSGGLNLLQHVTDKPRHDAARRPYEADALLRIFQARRQLTRH